MLPAAGGGNKGADAERGKMVWATQSLVKAKEKQWGSLLQGAGWQWGAACEALLGPRAAQCPQQGQHRAGHSSSAPAAGGVSAGPGQPQERTRSFTASGTV